MEARLDNLEKGFEARLDNLERRFENLLEMVQNINQTLQQRGNSSGDSSIGAEGNLEGQKGSRSGAVEEPWRRLEIPLFSGDDAYGWVNRVERYFNLKRVLEQERLQAVMVAMEGKTLFGFAGGGFAVRTHHGRISRQLSLDNRGKNEALKFKNQLGREQAIHKEVEQVKETNIKIVVAEKEMETELELHAGTVMEVQETDVADKIEGERKWDAVKENNFLGLMGQTQLIQVVHLRTKIVAGSVLQAIRFLCKTFKQKLEAGLGEAFKGSWLQEGLRGFSFDPGGTWLSAATKYSP
ncbi:hypothetical protein SESBI_32166 [Sesbania bispinosa]|nr:hypothetical protein SESBI_32166 [Sesbania bispinosa]